MTSQYTDAKVIGYRVKVTKLMEREKVQGQSYHVLRELPNGEKEYGYVDNPNTAFVESEVEVLDQRVDDLDLSAVVRAVNNL